MLPKHSSVLYKSGFLTYVGKADFRRFEFYLARLVQARNPSTLKITNSSDLPRPCLRIKRLQALGSIFNTNREEIFRICEQ